MCDAYPLPFPQVWMGHDGYRRPEGGLNRLDFGIRYDAWSIPAFTKNTHQATCLAHIEIAVLIEGLPQEQVTIDLKKKIFCGTERWLMPSEDTLT